MGDLHFFEFRETDGRKIYKEKSSEKYLHAVVNQDLGQTYKGWMVTSIPGDFTTVYFGTGSNDLLLCPTEYQVSKFLPASQTWTSVLSLN